MATRQMESIRSDRAIFSFGKAAAKAECDLARRGVRYTVVSTVNLKLGPNGNLQRADVTGPLETHFTRCESFCDLSATGTGSYAFPGTHSRGFDSCKS